MSKSRILVIGSINVDMVIKTKNIPIPGETTIGNEFFMNMGGKGANQAVAATRLGGEVSFVGKVGNDVFGKQAVDSLQKEGIDIRFIGMTKDVSSGIATITVEQNGENAIVVVPGANYEVNETDIDLADELFDTCEIILLQYEIPIKIIEYIIQKAIYFKKKVVLNPAPAEKIKDEYLNDLYIITPNETEAEKLTGVKIIDDKSTLHAADLLLEKGIQVVIITLGEKGALVKSKNICEFISSPKVKAIDTTAAGDTFNGALVVLLSEGRDILTATKLACQAASLSVTRFGAQASIPYRRELESLNK